MTKNLSLAPGVTLRALQTDKFKTGCFSVNFLRAHSREDAPLDALLTSVLLRGTETYPDMQSISTRLDELYGASFGTLVRRKGEVKLFGFYADFIEDEFLPEGEHVFADMVEFLEQILYHPYTEDGGFCARYVENEKLNLIHAIEASLNDKRAYATGQMLRKMCETEAYGVPRLGYAEDVVNITPAQLWAHYERSIKHCRIEIFYAGRKSAEEAAALFGRVFSHREEAAWEQVCTVVRTDVEAVREVSESMDITQGKLVLGLRCGITADRPDYAALNLLNVVYGAGMTSKLFLNVREARSLCYYASSTFDKYKGVMLISSGIAFENYEIAKNAILEELEACKRGEISGLELEAARIQALSSLRAAMDAPARLDDFYIGQAVLPCTDIPGLMQEVEALTVADLARAAQKLQLDTVYFLKGEEA